MAQPPDINETFLREVDENLRRDRAADFAKRYGKWLIAGVLLFLAASGGFIWWKQEQLQKSEGEVEQLAVTYRDIGSGNAAKAPAQLDALDDSSSKGIRASVLFTRAALAIQQNDIKKAIATYKAIAADESLPRPYRDAALVRQTALDFDQLKPEQVIARLQLLAKPGEPWFGSAGEMTALALIKQGKRQEAGQLFATLAKDKSVSETIRGRAVQIASTLGVDASDALKAQ